jgi:alpha-tubulin suppressor-like RCC1 family protein
MNTLAGSWTWVSAGQTSTCGIKGGAIYCWGHYPGQPPDTATEQPVTQLLPVGSFPWTEVEVGDDHVVAAGNEDVIGWGEACAASGVTGDVIAPSAAVHLAFGAPITATWIDVAVAHSGGDDSCAFLDSEVWCWGGNRGGELAPNPGGNGPCVTPIKQKPANGFGGTDAAHPGNTVSLSGDHGCFISSDSSANCWGDNNELEIGDRTDKSTDDTTEAHGNDTIDKLGVGPSYTCGITISGPNAVTCWGTSVHGELGNGTRFQDKPVLTMFAP